jgi:hypothetical protein
MPLLWPYNSFWALVIVPKGNECHMPLHSGTNKTLVPKTFIDT